LCAAAYALLVERTQQERQVAAILIAAGAEIELPNVQDLNIALGMVDGPHSDLTPEQRELRDALGLTGG
jgi:hypothetical protein